MNQKQQNRLSMNRAVLNELARHHGVWKGFAPFERAQAALAASVAGRETAAVQQLKPSTGVTGDKQGAREAAIDAALRPLRNAGVWARETGNRDLQARLAYSRTTLLHLPDNELEATLKSVLDAVTPHAKALAEYRITAADLAAARQALQDFHQLMAAPRGAVIASATATGSLVDHDTDSREALARLDGLIGTFTDTHPDFVSRYRLARVVVATGTRHTGNAPGAPDAPAS